MNAYAHLDVILFCHVTWHK